MNSARDAVTVTWLADGGLRIGELCGLHLVDLHLRDGAACGQCRTPHVHVCHRPGNPNGAEAKTKHPWRVEDGTVTGGLVKRVSPAMVHTYFDYMTSEYPRDRARARDAAGPAARHERRVSRGRRSEPGGCSAAPGSEPGWAG